ncbi:MAG: hypothetical protein RR543_00130 [Erysipelotrichales bacterium]
MLKKENIFEVRKVKVKEMAKLTNEKIEILGQKAGDLAENLISLQLVLDKIDDFPSDINTKLDILRNKRIKWIQQAQIIEDEFEEIEKKASSSKSDLAYVSFESTTALGAATVFGVATNRATIEWLETDNIKADEIEMSIGDLLLLLTGPVGWSTLATFILESSSTIFKGIKDKKGVENVFTSIVDRNIESFKLSIVELSERIIRIDSENIILEDAKKELEGYENQYCELSERQKLQLMTYLEIMDSATKLLIEPIKDLQPKIVRADFVEPSKVNNISIEEKKEELYIYLGNLLFDIDIEDVDKNSLCNSLNKNVEFKTLIGLAQSDIDLIDLENICKIIS